MTENVLQAEKVQEQPEMAAESAQPESSEQGLYNKDQVSKVVARERERAYEKGKREGLMELQQQQQAAQQSAPPEMAAQPVAQPPQQQAQQPQQQPQSLGGMQQMSPDQIRQMIQEHAPQVLQDHFRNIENKQTVDSFVSKMKAAEARHPGLESKLNELDYSTIAPIIKAANEMENTGDIMAELLDNPMKMGNLTSLIYTQPKLAHKAMQELSNSIKQNQTAIDQEQSANEPFGTIKSSVNAGMDNGAQNVSDFRKMPWLRG